MLLHEFLFLYICHIAIISLNNVINYIGEGCKPIFDREEIKTATIKTNKVEERRTVVAIDKEQSGMYYLNNCLLFIFKLYWLNLNQWIYKLLDFFLNTRNFWIEKGIGIIYCTWAHYSIYIYDVYKIYIEQTSHWNISLSLYLHCI